MDEKRSRCRDFETQWEPERTELTDCSELLRAHLDRTFGKVIRLLGDAQSINDDMALIKERCGHEIAAQIDARVFDFGKQVMQDLVGDIRRQTEKQRARVIAHNRELQKLKSEVVVTWQERFSQQQAQIESIKAQLAAEQ